MDRRCGTCRWSGEFTRASVLRMENTYCQFPLPFWVMPRMPIVKSDGAGCPTWKEREG